MPWACFSLSPVSSRTEIPIFWMEGKDSTGTGVFFGAAITSSTHWYMLRFIAILLFLLCCFQYSGGSRMLIVKNYEIGYLLAKVMARP